ncbi:hypothetical protein MCAV_04540 [[Mycoplasma] cavipharyngis]|uniref:hypothetical protein n=1 Tax=[Mycoplasma] cavipharyngis TaxID=92757 RepID=UPI0037045534
MNSNQYIIVKKPINFDCPIVINSFVDFDAILSKWSNKLQSDDLIFISKKTLFLKIFEELETKSFIDATIEYIKTRYMVAFNSPRIDHDELSVEKWKENIIIHEFMKDFDIKINDQVIHFFDMIMPNTESLGLQSYLIRKEFQNFLLKKFKHVFNYTSLINYLNYKNGRISLDVNLKGFRFWSKIEWWLESHNLNFLGKSFTKNLLDHLWKNVKTKYLSKERLVVFAKEWYQNSFDTLKLKKTDLTNISETTFWEILEMKILQTCDNEFIDNYQTLFQEILENEVDDHKPTKFSDLIYDVAKQLIDNHLFYQIIESDHFLDRLSSQTKTINNLH